jgi:hypothetical protein
LVLTEETELKIGFNLISVIFRNSNFVAEYTRSLSVIKTNQLMLHREIIAVCSEIHTKHKIY